MSYSLPEITVDFDACETCRAQLTAIYNAYMKLIAGGTRLKVRHLNRWTEYHPGNARQLRDAYVQLYDQCPDAETSGLPRLAPERGGPAYVRYG